ncbi:oxygenase MpaB family protein [Psychroserpens sp. Hel_I_66]|uniref:oxygenase MpaB family protein n=1 Tax=Psychroserpens sp. Hel_I_66 TaxID=1250004 RepID=UPI0006477D31|nr:oxygenase MpaB family protein [Psychroserpens sp. Hel_I_66]
MDYFVEKNSIVREIWGKSDTILLVFAGASAEFALSVAVDWLYFTGKIPNDPLGRLFSTVAYARDIVFSEKEKAHQAIDRINQIHGAVEEKRGEDIPNWAYQDVLFMLIDYSIRAYEILERPLKIKECNEVFEVFLEVGKRMNIKDLPQTYEQFKKVRNKHLNTNYYNGDFTKDLYKQYRKHLGIVRYNLLIETQIMLTPKSINQLLNKRQTTLIKPLISIYKLSRTIYFDSFLKAMVLPNEYQAQIKSMNTVTQ